MTFADAGRVRHYNAPRRELGCAAKFMTAPAIESPPTMQSEALVDLVQKVLARAPEWLRTDLAARDPLARERAEETLAAMISAAFNDESTS